MPTVITHAAVPLCIGLGLGSKVIPPRLLFAGIILAMLPDADVLSFNFGVAYGNVFGHRGFTHSLVFAFVVPLLCVLIGRRWFRAGLIRCWLFLTVSLLSHSLLDSVTTGGKGVGWLKRRTKNAKMFHDKCENFNFRASNETAALTAAF
ncbi:metal-dependent hydrolase, partial [Escherichia coli]